MKKGLRLKTLVQYEEPECLKCRPDEKGIKTRCLLPSGIFSVVWNVDLMKKGLRRIAPCVSIKEIVWNVDLMKKGLRLSIRSAIAISAMFEM